MKNSIGMKGIDFVEFTGATPEMFEKLFFAFGFSKKAKLAHRPVYYFNQQDIHFFLNQEKGGFSEKFSKTHGPSLCAMGWRFENPKQAFEMAISRGAKAADGDYKTADGAHVPAIYGIGESLVYFVDENTHLNNYASLGFENLSIPILKPGCGFTKIDHLTNNVYKGSMKQWADFYKNIFGFEEVRYFDIRGAKTGLTSFALRSPCGSFCIPINEAEENKSQINEYLEEYKGPGVQHLAFLTDNILQSLDGLSQGEISMLDIESDYYKEIFNKFPQVTEDHQDIQKKNVLVDGDDEGYLLQIFTKNLIGPIFIEIIQRKNHNSFGEGNFGALFRSIERDQMKRGVLT